MIRINEKSFVQNMAVDTQTTLPIEIDSRWIHMNEIEHDKLEWMKDLPKPSVQQTTDDSVSKKILSNSSSNDFFSIESRRFSCAF